MPEAAPEASGVCATPLSFAGVAYGVSEVPLPLASSGNGNCSVALGFPETAGVVPHGTGCGATEQGTRSAAGEGAAAGVGAGPAFGVLCAPQATAAHAAHTPATTGIQKCLRISIPFPSSLDDSPCPNVFPQPLR